MKGERIAVIGMGYVGLCTAVAFASRGFETIGVDIDEGKLEKIRKGRPPFLERGLEEALAAALERSTLALTGDAGEAVERSEVTFIAVGTPNRPRGGIDLRQVVAASEEVGAALSGGYHLVVVKSTVVPGTTDGVVNPVLEGRSGSRCGGGFGLCYNPEFLREGTALRDILEPDRIVIGEHDPRSGAALEELYRRFYGDGMPPTLRTSPSNAEMIKYASNALLAAKVSLINAIASICERMPGSDIVTVARGVGLDPRISPHFLRAGLGYGGSCFPKDLRALIAFSRAVGYRPRLLEEVEGVNRSQPLRAVEMAEELVGGLRDRRVAVLGLAFKPNTDDMREAVSVKIINRLLREGAEVSAYDPAAMENARKVFGRRITYAPSALACLEGADCCIVVTEWDEFRELRPEEMVRRMRTPAVVDGRRILDPEAFSRVVKFAAIGLGPGVSTAKPS